VLQDFVKKNREPLSVKLKQDGTVGKLAQLVKNYHFVLPKEIWDFLEENISNADIYETYLALSCINARENNLHTFVRAFLYNRALFQEFFHV